MIIVQTPLRLSFFGGGTDFRSFFGREGGCVLTTAIDKYIFVAIKKRFDQLLRVGYTRTEMVRRVDDVRHELIREALRLTGIGQGVEITTMGDIPSAGSGLGSSSTVTVGALHAMYTYLGQIVTANQLAAEACAIELDILRKPMGIQDQYIAAHGGLRFMEFHPSGEVTCTQVALRPEVRRRLSESLLLFYTGITRQASTILGEQQDNINGRLPILCELKRLAHVAYNALLADEPEALGPLLHEAWLLKKQLAHPISNEQIEAIYQSARRAGAVGGKIAGAGGGGFLLVYCPKGKHDSVRAALGGLQELPFQLEPDGSKVIFNYRR